MLPFLRRRAWLITLTGVVVASLAYLVASLRPVTYTADSVVIVPSGAGGTGPGQANEALRLALTYSELIPRDSDVLVAVAAAVRLPVETVSRELTVTPLGETALLQLRYASDDPARAVLGSRTAAETVVGGVATADTVPRGSVRLVTVAGSAMRNGGVSPGTAPIGLLLGLALGSVLAIAAERSDRRVDRVVDVETVLDATAVDLDKAMPAGNAALLRLWAGEGATRGPTVVGVVGVELTYADVVDVCRQLARVDGRLRVHAVEPDEDLDESTAIDGPSVLLVPTGVPGSGQPREQVVAQAHVLALLLPRGVRRAEVADTVAALRAYAGVVPRVVLLTGFVRRKRTRTHASSPISAAAWADPARSDRSAALGTAPLDSAAINPRTAGGQGLR